MREAPARAEGERDGHDRPDIGQDIGRAQLGLLQKVATLVPLALLSAAASVSIAGAGSGGQPC